MTRKPPPQAMNPKAKIAVQSIRSIPAKTRKAAIKQAIKEANSQPRPSLSQSHKPSVQAEPSNQNGAPKPQNAAAASTKPAPTPPANRRKTQAATPPSPPVKSPQDRARVPRRPRSITPEMARIICDRVAGGRVLLSVSRDKDIPHYVTIQREMGRNPAFKQAIDAARAASAHGLAEQVVEISDSLADLGPDVTTAQVHAVKNRCDQRRWLASKYNAGLFGEVVRHTDADGGSLATRLTAMSQAQLLAWAQGVAAEARALLEGPVIEHEPQDGDG